MNHHDICKQSNVKHTYLIKVQINWLTYDGFSARINDAAGFTRLEAYQECQRLREFNHHPNVYRKISLDRLARIDKVLRDQREDLCNRGC